MHWLVVIPYYFFSAVLCFLVLALAARILRLRVGANLLATAAVVLGVAAAAVPLAAGWVDVAGLTLWRLLGLAAVSFAAAALDALLRGILPLPADRDLAAL